MVYANKARVRSGGFGLPGAVLCCTLGLVASAHAAKIGLNPLMGDGAPGRNTVLSGDNFGATVTYAISVGGFAPVSPASVASNGAGVIASTTLVLPNLPGGNLDVVLTGGGRTITFTGAYRVNPNICLNPAQGEGRPGQTWLTNPAMPVASWDGMFFQFAGTGFAAGATVPRDTILIGGAATKHPDLVISAAGRISATGIVVTGNLSNGRKDLVINDGTARTFTGAYEIRRSVALRPSRGERAQGTTIFIEGWGFQDGTIVANTMKINGWTATHTATVVTAGHFTTVLTVPLTMPNNSNADLGVNDGVDTVFPGAYFTRPAPNPQMSITPALYGGGLNAAILVEGLANWNTAGIIAANSVTLFNAGQTVAIGTTHWGMTVTGGHFPPTWVRVNATAASDISLVTVPDAAGLLVPCPTLTVTRTLGVCPLLSPGELGWTVTVTGSGFTSGNLASITVGGAAVTTNPSPVPVTSGGFGPAAVTPSARLPNGAQTVVINDGAAQTFAGAVRVRRSIGLSLVVGPGDAAQVTSLQGTGFAAVNLPANSVTLSGSAVTHPLATVAADGSFGATALTLPSLNAGAYDLFAQGESFPGAYHVANAVVRLTKYVAPPLGIHGDTVTYTFSFTNLLGAAEPDARSLALLDTIPAGMQYVAGSGAATLPATLDWFSSVCTCFTAVEPAPANVLSIRWRLASPLPTGASGYASFRVTVN